MEYRFTTEQRRVLRDLFESPGWKLVVKEIQTERLRNMEEGMTFGAPAPEMLMRQGQHKALDWFLRLEEDLLERDREAAESAAQDSLE